MVSVVLILLLLSIGSGGDRSRDVRNIHVIFSNHLDIGFHSNIEGVPGTDAAVITRYFRDYYPAAIAVAEELRQRPGQHRFRYLTHSFLVSLYLDCPSQIGVYCPNGEEVAAFEAAVLRGDILWHAFPFNAQIELLDAELLNFAVTMTQELDRGFGLPQKRTMSQRDVPGLTRAAVPILARAGVAAVSIGVNSGSAPPGAPHNTPFIWLDERSNISVLAFIHPGA